MNKKSSNHSSGLRCKGYAGSHQGDLGGATPVGSGFGEFRAPTPRRQRLSSDDWTSTAQRWVNWWVERFIEAGNLIFNDSLAETEAGLHLVAPRIVSMSHGHEINDSNSAFSLNFRQ